MEQAQRKEISALASGLNESASGEIGIEIRFQYEVKGYDTGFVSVKQK